MRAASAAAEGLEMIDSEVQRVAEDIVTAQGMLGAQQSQLQDLHAAADACTAARDTLQDVSDATVVLAADFSVPPSPLVQHLL